MQNSSSALKKFFAQPLLHFVLIGFLIFVFSAWRGDKVESRNENIVVSVSDVERLANLWQQTWKRVPTEEELQALVRDHIKEEIYYREALALGLDINDTVIRRRLRQKMEFLSNDKAELLEPDESDLKAFFMQNKEKYKSSDVFSFKQIYFSADSKHDIQEALVSLNSNPENFSLGDSISLPKDLNQADQAAIERVFGSIFYKTLSDVEIGKWTGPIESGFGKHLVLVKQREPAQSPVLSQVKEKVKRDWRSEQRSRYTHNEYEKLRSKYQIEIENPDL